MIDLLAFAGTMLLALGLPLIIIGVALEGVEHRTAVDSTYFVFSLTVTPTLTFEYVRARKLGSGFFLVTAIFIVVSSAVYWLESLLTTPSAHQTTGSLPFLLMISVLLVGSAMTLIRSMTGDT